jgi:hypothetical protein
MAKKKAAGRNDFVMLAEVREILKQNPNFTGKQTLEALKERFPQQTIKENSAGVAYSKVRRELGMTNNRKVRRPKPKSRAAQTRQESPVTIDALQAARRYLLEVGDASTAIAAVRQVQALQLR